MPEKNIKKASGPACLSGRQTGLLYRVLAAIQAQPDRRFALPELAREARLALDALGDGVAEAFRSGAVARDRGYVRRRIAGDSPIAPGDFLWLYRQTSGQTQGQAAKAAGMHQSQWSDLESNRRSPTVHTLYRIAAAVGRHARELL